MKNKKRLILSATSIVAVGAAVVGTTFGMLTHVTEVKENKFSHGIVNIEIDEKFAADADIRKEEVEKEVRIQNSDAQGKLPNIVPIYIRAQLVPQWKNEKGELMPVNAESLLNYDLNLKNSANDRANVKERDVEGEWILADDGYYYFTGVVDPLEYTDDLLMSVKAKADADLPGKGHLEIEVLGDAVQAAGNAREDAWGTPTENKAPITFLAEQK